MRVQSAALTFLACALCADSETGKNEGNRSSKHYRHVHISVDSHTSSSFFGPALSNDRVTSVCAAWSRVVALQPRAPQGAAPQRAFLYEREENRHENQDMNHANLIAGMKICEANCDSSLSLNQSDLSIQQIDGLAASIRDPSPRASRLSISFSLADSLRASIAATNCSRSTSAVDSSIGS
jgi:hypothetical protein